MPNPERIESEKVARKINLEWPRNRLNIGICIKSDCTNGMLYPIAKNKLSSVKQEKQQMYLFFLMCISEIIAKKSGKIPMYIHISQKIGRRQ